MVRTILVSSCCWALMAVAGTADAQDGCQKPTQGCLQILDKEARPLGLCPLKHTDVDVAVSGFIARVTVTQQFQNPSKETIEAVYTFPMSERSAVDSMTMTVGDRTIIGDIKEREEARRIYDAARNAGQVAGLLDQERPNIFTQSVANILPGSDVTITISYVEYLKYRDGEYTFSFPMVVGPRYIPGAPIAIKNRVLPADPSAWQTGQPAGTTTDRVPDGARISPPITPEGTRAGHDISLHCEIDAGVPIRDVQAELHNIIVQRSGDNAATVDLAVKNEIPNRDFVLSYRVAGESIKDAVLTHVGAKGGFFSLILQPPDRVSPETITPKEMVFVIDSSGSMSGFPIEKAKETMKGCIEGMNPNDTFNLVSFSGGLGYCFNTSVPNNNENRRKALEYLNALQGGGGTEMMPAIQAALSAQADTGRLRVVCFMTDGFIGNDMEILDAIRKNVDRSRVFSFGIGNGVNRFLIEGMAREGRGDSEIVTLDSNADEAVERFQERIHSPLLTDIRVDFGDLPVEDVQPSGIPDLFSAEPLILSGRYSGVASGVITVMGNSAQGPYERKIDVVLPGEENDHDVLASLWARQKVEMLMQQDWIGVQLGQPKEGIKKEIIQLGLDFNLMTQFTSFVAVEERKVIEGGQTRTVHVPVEMMDGVSYSGVFGESAAIQQVQLSAAAAPAKVAGDSYGYRIAKEKRSDVSQSLPSSEATENEELSIRRESDDAKAPKPASKLAPELQGLSSKLVQGNYDKDSVRVVGGYIKVYLEVSDDSADTLQRIIDVGGRVISQVRSSRRLLVEVKVEALDKLEQLDFVKRITPCPTR